MNANTRPALASISQHRFSGEPCLTRSQASLTRYNTATKQQWHDLDSIVGALWSGVNLIC